MQVNVYKEEGLKRNHVDLHYGYMDEETHAVKTFLDSFQNTILGKNKEEEKERLMLPSEILYLEIVDRKCFLYLNDSEWQCDWNLQTFLDCFSSQGFVRISKSMAVNIFHIEALHAEFNMRVNIVLDNGETVILNRSYRKTFYQYLDMLRKGGRA